MLACCAKGTSANFRIGVPHGGEYERGRRSGAESHQVPCGLPSFHDVSRSKTVFEAKRGVWPIQGRNGRCVGADRQQSEPSD
jgi:hypothetical protein